MLIMMQHPQHGRMPVYSTSERDQAMVHGWAVVPEAVGTVEAPQAPADEPAPAKPAKRRGGK
jgi:hypothetical protein